MREELKINLEGLKEAMHEFDFKLDHSFFESIDYSEYQKGDFNIKLRLNKTTRHAELKFVFDGVLEIICDSCGDEFELPLHFLTETIVRSGSEAYEDENLIILPYAIQELDLSHYLYESIIINLPAKKIHPDVNGESTCNPEALKKIEELNSNPNQNDIDPRWEILKKLKN